MRGAIARALSPRPRIAGLIAVSVLLSTLFGVLSAGRPRSWACRRGRDQALVAWLGGWLILHFALRSQASWP